MECEDCGSDEGVETVCPYADEIHGEEINVILCDDCEAYRASEI